MEFDHDETCKEQIKGKSSAHVETLRQWLFATKPGRWFSKHVRNFMTSVLQQGPIPEHIAFIMDGNRRWAKNRGLPAMEGHYGGMEALARILELCYRAGVTTVTIYAFSTENFKRSKEEIATLMNMMIAWLKEATKNGQTLQRYGAKVKFLGDLSLLRADAVEAIRRAENITRDNGAALLNVCVAYKSQDEMCRAVRETVRSCSEPMVPRPDRPFSEARIATAIQVKHLKNMMDDLAESQRRDSVVTTPDEVSVDENESRSQSVTSHEEYNFTTPSTRTSTAFTGDWATNKGDVQYPNPETITLDTLNRQFLTVDCPPLDLLIRTSGVSRLSDFMLWQCHETTDIVYLDCMWPDFDVWSFLPVLVNWQRNPLRHATTTPRALVEKDIKIQ